jgi:uncharacterized membrane-anchored protein YhcB (DUF1043 family)
MKQIRQDYRDVLEHTAHTEEALAAQFATLADELERQGQPRIAEFLQVASRHHRERSIKNRALVASLESHRAPL